MKFEIIADRPTIRQTDRRDPKFILLFNFISFDQVYHFVTEVILDFIFKFLFRLEVEAAKASHKSRAEVAKSRSAAAKAAANKRAEAAIKTERLRQIKMRYIKYTNIHMFSSYYL